MIFLVTLLTAVLLTIVLIPVLSSAAIRYNAVDLPNERKVHTRPIPRIGGLAMAAGTFIPLLYVFRGNAFLVAYLAGAGVLVAFGLVDDFRELSPKVKFAGQILAAFIAVFHGGVVIRSLGTLLPDGWLLPEWLAMALTLLVIVGVTNAINLADGLDGLAGGISLLMFAGIGYLAYLAGNAIIGLICLAIGGALFGFLRFNTHPATIFMGDAGSQFLGFSVVTLAIALTQGTRAYSPLLPLLLVGFPVLDTLTVMITRIVQGRSPFTADKNHFHHHLLQLGFLHPESVLIIYVVQTLLVIAALFLRYHSDWLLLLGYLLFCGGVLAVFTLADRTGWRPRGLEQFNLHIGQRIRELRDHGRIIKNFFPLFSVTVPLLLFVTCVRPMELPPFVTCAAGLFGVVILTLVVCGRQWLMPVLRLAIYLLIPCAVYFGDVSRSAWQDGMGLSLYNASFGLMALLMIVISRFSRRQEGFKSTPLDFLIVMLAVVAPNLPVQRLNEYQLGMTAARIIMLYFSFEVLFAELRGKSFPISVLTASSLLVMAFH
ncbi:undecaprenyl/decaprenyl-phosphate alpha-N-acetylglucosaminyl 1-phosphate transferase [Geobacter pelophilus]|uniref:Undecaprenyl/decaprenyl-phosphate alpha-N-acetylglucosaminyl 1-phosphate transferase n=1 Tax=Geoanaerobacter pelophilus TaxID=60036 RepID=A0AAW4LC98_9BACT|nr:MraY family glycosyltransferase [Geoanaerobacter pelophilus]MBT0666190.1 undecaprenyl/decaprenyl-phosphate alpha-N-acetylglucosaminyl 1-phosphate transferase [Geoanaerobacter pelophilus]